LSVYAEWNGHNERSKIFYNLAKEADRENLKQHLLSRVKHYEHEAWCSWQEMKTEALQDEQD